MGGFWGLVIPATLTLGGLSILFGVLLGISSRVFAVEEDVRVKAIREVLPGVNCGMCGYSGCEAYAEAVVSGEAPDKCAPGGKEVAEKIKQILSTTTHTPS